MDFPFIKEALSQLFSKPSCQMYVPDKTKEGAPNYRGRIVFHPDKCINCMMCERVCSGNAITHVIEKTPEGDDKVTRTFYLGSCTFCATCMDFCGHGAIEFTRDYHMIATKEEDLMVSGTFIKKAPVKKAPAAKPAASKAETAPAAAPAEGGRVIKPRDDGKPVQVPSKCVYCTICAKKCPAGALEVDRANKTWKLDEDNCVGCGTCAEACPKKAILMPGDEPVTEAAPVAPAAPAPKAEEKAAPAGAMISPRDDGKPVQVPSKCVYCTICAKKCPAGALEVDRANKTWTLDEDSCVGCGTCAEACPKKAILMPGDEPVPVDAPAAAPAPKAAAPAPAPKKEEPAAPKAEEKPAEPPKPVEPRDDGRPVQDPAKCIYCTICARKCPVGALEVDRTAKTWKLDEDVCIGCGNCYEVCPKKAIVL